MILSSAITKLIRTFRGKPSTGQRLQWGRGEWWMFGVSVIALAGAWVMVVNGFPIGAVQIVTHYSIPFGIDGIGPWWQTWIVPTGATVVTLFHLFFLAPWAKRHSAIQARFVHVVTVLLNVGAAWAIFLLRYQQLPT